jgi:RNA polymerase sigma-70 factor (ECF subfamily)
MSDADDRGLLERIAARDKIAFETFFRAHGSGVHRFVRDLVRDDGLAEELTSDVMVEVWRNAGKYGGRSRARTWVFGIAHHKAIDALRKRRATLVPLDEALSSLSAEHRAVLELTYVEGFSQKEIAEIVDVPVATVKTRAFYAKQRLRDALATAEHSS